MKGYRNREPVDKDIDMELEKMRELGREELKSEQVKVAEQLFRIRFSKNLGKQDGLGKIRDLKKSIARMKTIDRERVLAEQKAGK